MMNNILEIFTYPFMARAVIAGVILACVFAVLSVFTVLRKMSFFADGVAHASLAGVALGIIFSVNPLISAIGFSIFFAIVLFILRKNFDISSDTAIGILFTTGMSLGILLISFQPGYQPDLLSYLFGNILSITIQELYILGVVSFVVLFFIAVFWRTLLLVSFNTDLATVAGVNSRRYELLLDVVLAVTVVLGIKVFGIILVSALLVIPYVTASLFVKSFKGLVFASILFAEIFVLVGITFSYFGDAPTGPTIVFVGAVLFLVFGVFKQVYLWFKSVV